MCVIVAKYFDGIGWAGAKNRDRNYTPVLDFIETDEHGTDRMMMHDQVTGYKEGINSRGVSILNTSLDVYDAFLVNLSKNILFKSILRTLTKVLRSSI